MPRERIRRKAEKFRLPADDHGNLIVPVGTSGEPDLGRVMRHYRKYVRGKEWTAEYVAMLYSQALQENSDVLVEDDGERKPVTARWIQYMEQHNRVPRDPGRRWILATLLGIPPVIFGLEPLDKALAKQEARTAPTYLRKSAIDTVTYEHSLTSDKRLFLTGALQGVAQGLEQRVGKLQDEVLYGNVRQKEQVLRLLCRHRILLGDVVRDRGDYNTAIEHLNMAYVVAKENDYQDLQAFALYCRGTVFYQHWDTRPDKKENRVDLMQASSDLQAASMYNKDVPLQLKGIMLLLKGMVCANHALSEEEKTNTLVMFDQGGSIVRYSYLGDDEHLLNLTEQLYHTNRGSALTALGRPRNAIDELALIYGNSGPVSRRRRAINDIYQARAYFDRGWYAVATTTAREALKVMKDIQSSINIARIANLYGDLKRSEYGKDEEVTMLGIELMKARQPSLFR